MRLPLYSIVTTTLVALKSTYPAHAQTYTLFNKCPIDIDAFVGNPTLPSSIQQFTIPTGQSHQVGGANSTSGRWPNEHVWSTSHGGVDSSGKFIGPRVFFDLRPGYEEYYIQRHPNPNNINLGISVTPTNYGQDSRGFCAPASCTTGDCDARYYQLMENKYPYVSNYTAPAPPVYRCLGDGVDKVDYTVTFCPQSTLPPSPPGTPVRASLTTPRLQKCLDVRGAQFTNGTAVQIYDCNSTPAQTWVVKQGTGQVRVKGTEYCLDAGSASPNDGTKLKIWQCIDNIPAQRWVLTNTDSFYDNIRLESKNQCVDLTKGDTTNGNVIQTWGCPTTLPTEIIGPQLWKAHSYGP